MRNIILLQLITDVYCNSSPKKCIPILNRLSELNLGNVQSSHSSSPSILCPATCCTSRNEHRFRFQLGQTVQNLTSPELKRISNLALTDLTRLRQDVYQRLTDARNKLNAKLTTHFPELNSNKSVINGFFTDSTFFLSSAENDHDPVLFGRHLFQNIHEILNLKVPENCPNASKKPAFPQMLTIGEVNAFADAFGTILRKTSAYWRSLKFVSRFHGEVEELIEHKLMNDQSCDEFVSVLYCGHCSAHHSVHPCSAECTETATRCLSDIEDIKRHVEMLIELMVIDVNRHKFGFAELDNYALSLDRAIFNILEKEIVARKRFEDASGCPNYQNTPEDIDGRISDRALHTSKAEDIPKTLVKNDQLWKSHLTQPVFNIEAAENLCHRRAKESLPCWDGYQIKDSEPDPAYEDLPDELEAFEYSESLKNELIGLIKDLAIVIKRTDKLKSMEINISNQDDLEGSAAEQLCDDEDGFCLGPHKEDEEASGDGLDSDLIPLPDQTSIRKFHSSAAFPQLSILMVILFLVH